MTTSPFTENDDFRSLSNAANGTEAAPIQAGAGADIVFGNGGNDVIQGEEGADILDGGTGNDLLDGGEDNDALSGGIGADTLLGQGGIDSAAYSDVLTLGSIVDAGDNWIITTTEEGVDQLNGIEIVTDGSEGGARYLLVGNGGFASIQAAIDAAQDGDTIVVGAGTWGAFTVPAGLDNITIAGVNHALGGAAHGVGGSIVNAYGSVVNGTGVTITGLRFDVTGNQGAESSALRIAGAGATVENSVFFRTGAPGSSTWHHAIVVDNAAGVTIADSLFDQAAPGPFTSTQSNGWRNGVLATGTGTADISITGNTFQGGGTSALSLLALGASTEVAGNTISGYGTFATIADPAINNPGSVFSDNSYTGPAANLGGNGTFLNAQAGSGPAVTVDADDLATAGNTSTTNGGSGFIIFNGGANVANDTLSGGSGNDGLGGSGGNDLLSGDAGNDVLTGGAGDDTLDGGEGTDTAVYGNGAVTVDLHNGTASGAFGSDVLTSIENVTTGNGNDVVMGTSGANVITTGAGNDTIDGRGNDTSGGGDSGDDVIDAGDGTADTVVMFDSFASYTIGFVDGKLTLTRAGETTTLSNVERVNFADRTMLVVDKDSVASDLVTIGAAVTAADAIAGPVTVLIADGSYAEDVAVTRGDLTFAGQSRAGVVLSGQVSVTGTQNGALAFQDLTINAAGESYGILHNALAGAGATLSLARVSISGALENALLYTRPGNSSTPSITTDLLSGISIVDSHLSDSGITNTGNNGRGLMNLFGFNGDLTVTGSTFSVSSGEAARKGIAVTGSPRTGTLSEGGAIVFEDNSIEGAFLTDAIAFYYFADFASFAASGNTADVTAPWGVLNIDKIGGAVSIADFFSSATNAAPQAIGVLQGNATDDSLTGSDFNDVLLGNNGNDVLVAGHGADYLDGGAGDDTLTGDDRSPEATGADTLIGGAGNDVLIGGAGADSLVGGGDTDTAQYSETLTTADISAVGGGWQVQAGGATDTLASVEVISHAGGRILLVGNGGYATIQAAIDAAASGDTIVVASGSFAGATVTKDLTIHGAKHGVAGYTTLGLTGEARDADGETVMTGGFTVQEGVSVEINGFRFVNTNAINTNSGSLVQDVVFANNVVVGGANQFIGNANGLGTVSVTGNFISSATSNGFQINGAGNGAVTIEGNLFDGTGSGGAAVNANGIATFDFSGNVVMNTNSHGIQVAGAMGDVTIDGNTFDGTVQSGALDRGAISVANPQGFTSLSITDNTVTDSPFGVVYRGANDANPGAITPTLSGNDFTGATVSAFGYAGNNSANLLTGGAEDAVFRGFDGADTLFGGGGDDAMDGGTGVDVALFDTTIAAASVSASGGGWTVENGDDSDTLANVEVISHAGGRILLVGAGGFATIQAAIDAANAGDTVILAAGTYGDAVTIDKAITLLGPNAGVAGTESRDDEAVITGPVTISAASGDVTIGGVEFRYTGAADTLGVMLNVTGAADVTIEDNRFYTEAAQGAAGSGRAIQLTTAAGGNIAIDDNFFGGVVVDPAARFGGANFNRAIWSDGSSASLAITDNTIVNARTAVNLDGFDAAPVTTVTGNTIVNSGSGFSIATPGGAAITGISGNVFQNVQSDFNLQNVTTAFTFATGTNSATTLVSTEPGLRVLGGTQDDALTGNDGIDELFGRNGNDTLDGGGGDDVLSGGAGNDSLVGGAGNDAATFAAGTTLLKNFDGSVTATGPDGTDQLSGVETAFVGTTPVDLAAIPTPNVTISLTTDTGEDDAADATSDATVNGTGRPLTDVKVTWTVGATSLTTTVTADAAGNWSASLPSVLPDGEVSVTAEQKDGLGVTDSAGTAFLYDTVMDAPDIDLDPASDTGAFDDDYVTGDNTLALSGTAEAGSVVVIKDDLSGDTLGTFTVGVSGTWTFTTDPLDDGTYGIFVIATDAAGNGNDSDPILVFVDTTAPDAPTIDLLAASDSGASAIDNITNDTTLRLAGTAEAGSKVEVFSGTTSLGFADLVGGDWTFTRVFDAGTLPDGDYALTVVSTDLAGNETGSSVLTVTVDRTMATPTIDLVAASDSGVSDTDNLTSDATPSLSGTAEANSTVEIFDGATSLGSVTADGTGNWSFTSPSLAAGAHGLTVTATDAAGNSATSAVLTVAVDVATATPTIDLDAASDSANDSDNITTDTTPSLSGTAEKGASVEIFRNGTSVGTVTADSLGAWSFTSAALADGSYSFTAVATDAAGNVSASSAGLAVTIDTTAPAAPVLTAAGAGVGNTLTVVGTAEANAEVEVFIGAVSIGTATADDDGDWALENAAISAGGAITARATDDAGNVSAVSASYTLGIGLLGGALTGGAGADSLGGSDGADTLAGMGGNDTLNGGAENDTADYRHVAGGITVDLAAGTASGEGDDMLISIENVLGGAGVDFIFGSAAANLLVGGGNDDILDGAEGNDTLLGGAGADEISGGDGFDVLSYAGSGAAVQISLAAASAAGGDAEGDVFFDVEGVIGSGFADSLVGSSLADLLDGAVGNDTLIGGAGADTLIGGDGFDTASYAGSSAVNVNLATGTAAGGHATGDVLSGIEALIGGNGSDVFTGNAVANILSGENGNDRLIGNSGNDTLSGGIGNDTLDGGDDADSLSGGDGADSLSGGASDDVLFGGLGKDTLSGGAGADRFVWTSAAESAASTAGRDVVADWGVGDRIDLSGFDANIVLAGVQSFTFRGTTSSFSTANAGDVWTYVFGGTTYIIAGVDGDAVRDFQIELTGVHALTLGSFIGVGGLVLGTSASETLTGFDGNDTVSGLDGADTLTGGLGADSLNGGGGEDVLEGGEGNDVLQGGAGSDVLIGGGGRDTLAGGDGLDRYVWTKTSDSTASATTRDVVSQWQAGELLDLSLIDALTGVDGDQAFTFGGVAASRTAAGAGQVFFYTSGGNTFVIAGVDGDGIADMEFALNGLHSLTAADFVL